MNGIGSRRPPNSQHRRFPPPPIRRSHPAPSPSPQPRHSVRVLHDSSATVSPDLDAVLAQCQSPRPENLRSYSTGGLAGVLFFSGSSDARDSVLCLWRSRLSGFHTLFPRPNFSADSPEFLDLEDRLRVIFSDHVRTLIVGDEVATWSERHDRLSDEVNDLSARLRKKMNVNLFSELSDKIKALKCERDLVLRRILEFRSAMDCFLAYFERKSLSEYGEDSLPVIKLEGEVNWVVIHSLILRECRRLKDGLPIYAYRQQILTQIHSHQITVLVGETGSGKSTQLVQFLADSQFTGDQAIVCTQPRKIAASSLANRVREECLGCFETKKGKEGEEEDTVIAYCPILPSEIHSKVIFTSDHALLQHYMSCSDMSTISCIIVDEAHERSLNTDLLLALVRTLLLKRSDLRLVIMSATIDAERFSDYFFGCGIFQVSGRNFPVEIRYAPCYADGDYVSDVVRTAVEIHRTEKEGAILAFLTSQNEVEWACEQFRAPGSVAIPLHGKLSSDEQFQVFKKYHGKRKVIFATNLAETSLTIPGVKYVIDSGMVKESKYEPKSGMNVLKVCWISQSSANQRAGRAGRTEPGTCYRLYSESDFEIMPPSPEPEIRRVHLGIAALRIFALGIKNMEEFNFMDAPSPEAIDVAVRNLVQLQAVQQKDRAFELTDEGRLLVKMGIEPRLGKLILGCFSHRLGREGIVLAAVMANSSSIFFRVGSDEEKLKSDCLKVKFCHHQGDLFTLLSVYKEWESVKDGRSKWCLENSINAKTMRRCHDTVVELESCLKRELHFIVPTLWYWNPNKSTDFDKALKKVILYSLVENVAMYSGNDQLGYEVALNGQHVQLHPSCSLLVYDHKPSWVVFSEILSVTREYLVCVTSFDFESLLNLYPQPPFNPSEMESRKLQINVLTGFGATILKRFCGKSGTKLLATVSRLREQCVDERISVKVYVEQNEIRLFARSEDMEKVEEFVRGALECEKRWMSNECLEKSLYQGPGVPPIALFGAGAEIKHLELEKRCLTVDVQCSNARSMDPLEEREILNFIENFSSGTICGFHKLTSSGYEAGGDEDMDILGRITFLSPDAAQKAAELNPGEHNGTKLKVIPSQPNSGGDQKASSFPTVNARVQWPRKESRGVAVVICDERDVGFLLNDFSRLIIGDRIVHCERGNKSRDSVLVRGFDKELSDHEIASVLRGATRRRIQKSFIIRGPAHENPPPEACAEALFKEIAPLMPKSTHNTGSCRVQVFPPELQSSFMRAMISFDGRFHHEAAKALEQIDGKVLPGCQPWQKIFCQQVFHSSLTCSVPVYSVIRKQLDDLIRSLTFRRGVECDIERNYNGSYRVKIVANATRTIAEVRRSVEELMRGKAISHESLAPAVLQHLFSRDGVTLMQSLERETGTHIFFERYSLTVRIFGPPHGVAEAERRLIEALSTRHESKQLEIHLRGKSLPQNLMKQVVTHFGPDLRGLRERFPAANFTLNTRRHVVIMQGDKALKPEAEKAIIHELDGPFEEDDEAACPICLCDLEDPFQLETCLHRLCRSCLLEHCDSAIRNQQDSFPLRCSHKGCGALIQVPELRQLLSPEKLEELFRAAVGAFVAASGGAVRFCPSPDCPGVYRAAGCEAFTCGSCWAETCRGCQLESHPFCTCEMYREMKDDPDISLKEWRREKQNVKDCPLCGSTIEKVEGCNHMECRCSRHLCWLCLADFDSGEDCYTHLRDVHVDIAHFGLYI